MKTSRVLWIVFLSIMLGCVGPAFSQSSTGSISGTVTDQNHAVVEGAKVVGKNTLTGFVRPMVTNSSGIYRLTDIPSGKYEITIEAARFKTFRTEGHHSRNSFFTLQSGAPVTVTQGSDTTGSGNPIRPNLNTTLDLSSMTITEILAAGGAKLFRGLDPGQRVGNAGRNILRSDGINLVDFGIIKNTRLSENVRIQFRADMFNSLNSRNFGIPNGVISSGANFLNQWATNGGNRRIVLGARLVF